MIQQLVIKSSNSVMYGNVYNFKRQEATWKQEILIEKVQPAVHALQLRPPRVMQQDDDLKHQQQEWLKKQKSEGFAEAESTSELKSEMIWQAVHAGSVLKE